MERKTKLARKFKKTKEESKLFALKEMLNFNDPTYLSFVLCYLNSLPQKSKKEAIYLISNSIFSSNKRVLHLMIQWHKNNPFLKGPIQLFLSQQGCLHPKDISIDINSLDFEVRSAAILTILRSNSQTLNDGDYAKSIYKLTQMLSSKNEVEICYAIKILAHEGIKNNIERILPLITHNSTIVQREALKAIAYLIEDQYSCYASIILERLNESFDSQIRIYCLEALSKVATPAIIRDLVESSYSFRPNEKRLLEELIVALGEHSIPILLTLTKDATLPEKCRITAGRSLALLAPRELQTHLNEIISEEINRAYFYFFHSNTIQTRFNNLDLKMLENALLTSFQSIIDFIIQMLSSAGSIEDCELISRSLRNVNDKIHSQAVETLEKTCPNKIFKQLKPLIDRRPKIEVINMYRTHSLANINLESLLDLISSSSSLINKILAVSLKAQFNIPDWQSELKKQMKFKKQIFQSFAMELLQTC